MNMTLQQIDRGLSVDQASKDRAISNRVMKTIARPMEDKNPAFPFGSAGDENDSPTAAVKAIKLARGNNMAIHI